ncbi:MULTISPECIES: hypothetical protein [unclassified Micromonospora]|nr:MULTISPECIES: hypothetical protein [unclassified Micromonospora]
MRKVLLSVPVLAVAALTIPPVRRWLDTVLIRTTGTTVRTNRRV